MALQKGFSLLEFIIFSTIIAVLSVGLAIAFTEIVTHMPTAQFHSQAILRAEQRLEYIIGYFKATGEIADPCQTVGNLFCDSGGYTITVSTGIYPTSGSFQEVTVTASKADVKTTMTTVLPAQ